MSAPATVGLSIEDRVATITLDRSARHNSLTPEFLASIEDAIGRLSAADAAVVVLRARGRSFSTGGDVAGFYAHRHSLADYADRTVAGLNRVILELIRLEVPVVVAVHGMVTGGSLGIVLAGDVVVVSPDASFTPWYREVGFAPDGGWTVLLPRLIGRVRAADVLMCNRSITAHEAVAWGMASRVVPSATIQAEADRVAHCIASGVGGSIRHSKRRLWHDLDAIARELDDERHRFVEQVVTDEAAIGMARFLRVGQ